ncbi:MAG: hypothetical protein ABI843_08485 [Dokdonella sp.]
MTDLMQLLVRAYLPLAARHMLVDAAAHVPIPIVPAIAAGDAKFARIVPAPRRTPRQRDSKSPPSLAA